MLLSLAPLTLAALDPATFVRDARAAGYWHVGLRTIAGTPKAAGRHALPALFPYVQLCDGPAKRPADMEGLIRQSGGARLDPGTGAFDLAEVLRALPAGLPISLEVPNLKRIAAIGPLAHAIEVREATEALLARL